MVERQVGQHRGFNLFFKVVCLLASLASSAHNRCTSLVCSCYAPSRNSYEGEESHARITHHNNNKGDQLLQTQKYKTNGGCTNSSNSNGSHHINPNIPLKSNLKRTCNNSTLVLEEVKQVKTGTRKVSWPDAHGKAIAHVQEFEPSVPRDWELEGVRNSCVCAIQ